MPTLTKDIKSERKQGIVFALPAAANAHIYSGALVSVNAAGYVAPASDTSGETFLGVSRKESNNGGGANGALTAEGYLKGIFHFAAPGITQADLAKEAWVVDDNSVGLGIVAQPVNATGVVIHRTALSTGGTRTLAYTAVGTTLSWGGGAAVNVGAGGSFTLAATDGSSIAVAVTAASLPVGNTTDSIQLRHVRAGRIIEVPSNGTVFVEVIGAARN